MIKELHASNKILRDNVGGLQDIRQERDSENFVLQNENRELRDRIEILENVVGAQTYDVQQDAWRDLLYPGAGKEAGEKDLVDVPQIATQNSAVSQMAAELLEYRKGKTAASGELDKLRADREELSMANL